MDPSTADFHILETAAAASEECWIGYRWNVSDVESGDVLVVVVEPFVLASAAANAAFLASFEVETSSWLLYFSVTLSVVSSDLFTPSIHVKDL